MRILLLLSMVTLPRLLVCISNIWGHVWEVLVLTEVQCLEVDHGSLYLGHCTGFFSTRCWSEEGPLGHTGLGDSSPEKAVAFLNFTQWHAGQNSDFLPLNWSQGLSLWTICRAQLSQLSIPTPFFLYFVGALLFSDSIPFHPIPFHSSILF